MPVEIQCKQEAAILIQQLPKTWLLCLPLRLAHTLLPHSLLHTFIHDLQYKYSALVVKKKKKKLFYFWLGFAASPFAPRALYSFGHCVFFFFLCFGRSSWHVGDKWPFYDQYRGVGAQ